MQVSLELAQVGFHISQPINQKHNNEPLSGQRLIQEVLRTVHDNGTERCLRHLHYRGVAISLLSDTITPHMPAVPGGSETPGQLDDAKTPPKSKVIIKHTQAS